MIVSSFYNTLINDEEAIPSTTMLEIERIRKKGIIFVVTTNGLYQEVLDYNKDFPFIDYIVSLNGSIVYDVLKRKIIHKKKLTISSLKKILALDVNDNISLYTVDNEIKKKTEIKDDNIYKIEIKEPTEQLLDKIKKINVSYSTLIKNNNKKLEIVSQKVSMFSGIDQIALKNNINLKEILVIAGNESDLSMINNIKNSFIVENCSEELKKTKANKTYSNNLNGVENILKKV